MPSITLTPWQKHAARWRDCRRCVLCEGRRKVVLARGSVPADVAFVGEAPGESEDVLGIPFIGPAGKLFNSILARAVPAGVRCFITNLVCCIPRGEDGTKTGEPDDEHIDACRPRLQEAIQIADPKLIVAVGSLARDWLDWKRKGYIKFHREIPTIDVIHPAYILRANQAQQGLLARRCEVTIANAIEEHCSAADAK